MSRVFVVDGRDSYRWQEIDPACVKAGLFHAPVLTPLRTRFDAEAGPSQPLSYPMRTYRHVGQLLSEPSVPVFAREGCVFREARLAHQVTDKDLRRSESDVRDAIMRELRHFVAREYGDPFFTEESLEESQTKDEARAHIRTLTARLILVCGAA